MARAIDSVLSQSYTDWELVVVDDGGGEDLSAMLPRHDRIRLVSQANRGVSVARNTGVAIASGEFVAFLDQDDVWHPAKLRLQMDELEAAGADFSHTGFRWVSEQEAIDAVEGQPLRYPEVLYEDYICLSSIVVRRSTFHAVGGFDPMLRIQQDFDFDARVGRYTTRTAFTGGPLVDYYVHSQNASRDYRAMWREAKRIYEDHAALAKRLGDDRTLTAVAQAKKVNNRLMSAKAFDEFRATRSLSSLAAAIQGDPAVSIRAIGRAVGGSRQRVRNRPCKPRSK